jgi:4-hydroxythreonine-4-phosphate dehydrogenase
MNRPVIGITIGDPSGAGPEVCLKALENVDILKNYKPILFGDETVIRRVMPIVECETQLNVLSDVDGYKDGYINLISLNNMMDDYEFGKVQAKCGKAGFEYIKAAIESAQADKIDAVVTGPINKEALNKAGMHYSGHTEIFADLTGTKDYAMLLTGGLLKVIHVTTHVSMREACDRIKMDRVYTVIKLANKAMKDLGIKSPKVAVAGLNPHSGENGLFGDEEIKEIIPAIEKAKAEGIDVNGPVPPDTVFLHCKNGKYHVVVAMYHDQGHIPLKLLDFMGGVNVTVGLPIIRTSVDHGTVFGKAGKGTADENSMIKAVEMAVQFALNRSK